jgi:hypothetical protein
MVPKRIISKRRVNEALHNMQWIGDFRGALTSSCFSSLMKWCCIKGHMTCISGDSRPQDSSLPNQCTKPYFKEPPHLNQQTGFGRPGPPTEADFLCGLWSTTGARLLTSLLGVGWNTLRTICYVTSSRKISTICFFHVCLPDR